jgi:hypothetical protein
MGSRQISWGRLVGALVCLLPVIGGVLLIQEDGGTPLGWALIGFFGAGVVVLGRKAFTGR